MGDYVLYCYSDPTCIFDCKDGEIPRRFIKQYYQKGLKDKKNRKLDEHLELA
jgi:hypothetical protein